MVSSSVSCLLLGMLAVASVDGFVLNKSPVTTQLPTTTSSSSTAKYVTIPAKDGGPPIVLPDIPPPQDIPYGEESRKYRRTVFTHEDWVKFRSSNRFLKNIINTGASGIYKNVFNEISIVTLVATLVVGYNCVVNGYTDLNGIDHAAIIPTPEKVDLTLRLPLEMFTLVTSSLGLLLAFRTNNGYKRWDEARKNWGMNINHTRDLNRMANAYYDSKGVSPEQRQKDLTEVALATWSFVRAMKRHLSPENEDEIAFRLELYEKLPREQAEKIIAAAHRPNRALFDLSVAIENLPMHYMRKNEIHAAVTIFEDNLGSSERLLTSPIPLFYSRHTARFLGYWMLLMPIGAYDKFASTWNHAGLIPATFLIALFLFGIEELATQMEEPFTILPMQGFCDKIYNWCTEISSWSPGDNEMPINPVKKEHNTVWDTVNGYNNGYEEGVNKRMVTNVLKK